MARGEALFAATPSSRRSHGRRPSMPHAPHRQRRGLRGGPAPTERLPDRRAHIPGWSDLRLEQAQCQIPYAGTRNALSSGLIWFGRSPDAAHLGVRWAIGRLGDWAMGAMDSMDRWRIITLVLSRAPAGSVRSHGLIPDDGAAPRDGAGPAQPNAAPQRIGCAERPSVAGMSPRFSWRSLWSTQLHSGGHMRRISNAGHCMRRRVPAVKKCVPST